VSWHVYLLFAVLAVFAVIPWIFVFSIGWMVNCAIRNANEERADDHDQDSAEREASIPRFRILDGGQSPPQQPGRETDANITTAGKNRRRSDARCAG